MYAIRSYYEIHGHGNRNARESKLLDREEVFFLLHQKEGTVFTTLDLRTVEETESVCKKTFIPVPEGILGPVRMNATGGVAVAIRLQIRVDQVSAIKSNAQRSCDALGA